MCSLEGFSTGFCQERYPRWVDFKAHFMRVPYCFGDLKRDPNLEFP